MLALAHSHYENFSVVTWFLPKHLHQHFYNVYAYCRISDDLGDEVGDPQQSLALLDEWEAELNATYLSMVEPPCRTSGKMLRNWNPQFRFGLKSVPVIRSSSRCAKPIREFDIPRAAVCRSAYGISPGPKHHALSHIDDVLGYCKNSANPWDIWCCTCAGIVMPSGSDCPTTRARRCNWQTSGKMSRSIMARDAFICRWKPCQVRRERERYRRTPRHTAVPGDDEVRGSSRA